ncbi:MAG TPA: hypothetical protein VNP02_01155 [Gammaproteobacteria bacterium]|nr:hypothetical protein [Gammaproteobacteria bacterium]
MRAFVQRPLAFAIASLIAVLPLRALAQADAPAAAPSTESVEEVTVRGEKSMTQYRLEIEQARDEVFRLYNEANEGKDNDITCRAEQPTGSRMRQDVCRSNAENKANSDAARGFLNSLLRSSGGYLGPGGGTNVNANIGTGAAQGAAQSGTEDSLAQFEEEWRRLLRENRQLYRAVVNYAELQGAYDRARGSTVATEAALAVLLEDPIAPAGAVGPQCEASTLTEYQQRNNVARVTGTVSIANCSAGTTGKFTLVARVRDDNGEIKPLEFSETWQRSDDQDHTFNTDYPIGDNVELMNVRVRGLTCTCAVPAQ